MITKTGTPAKSALAQALNEALTITPAISAAVGTNSGDLPDRGFQRVVRIATAATLTREFDLPHRRSPPCPRDHRRASSFWAFCTRQGGADLCGRGHVQTDCGPTGRWCARPGGASVRH